VQLDLRMGEPEFLDWVQRREGRLAAMSENRLDGKRWTVLTSDFGVDLGPTSVRYPDVVVDVAGGRLNDLTATAPILIAEIISPSSAKDDLGVKAHEYLRVPSLPAYVVLAQDEPLARVWGRGAEGLPPQPREIKG